MKESRGVPVPLLAIVASLMLLAGCATHQYAPKGGMLIYHRELPAADRAVEAARSAGKAAECPEAFREAEKLRDEAYVVYWSCRTAEAIALANNAVSKANALCPPKVVAPPPPLPAAPPPPPPPPPAPTATISAAPPSIQQGACTTLSWSSTNASGASIEPGLGTVALSGSQQVCPPSTTEYAIAATGAGGSARATTTVMVTTPPPPPPPPAPAPKVIDRLTIRVNFDFDKANIRSADLAELQKALDFVKRYPGSKVSIEGHTDGIGSVPYNQKLSERRAEAVKSWLAARGVDPSRMRAVGHGKSQPIADNATAAGRFQNRRVELLILSE